ncbi:MAG: KamA family radical SAM protein [Chlamydiales bacterium]
MPLEVLSEKNGVAPWKLIFRNNFRHLDVLADFLELTEEQSSHLSRLAPFSLNVPLRLAQKMEKGNINDPLFRQFVPFEEELIFHPSFKRQPIEEASFRSQGKLLHKYQGRVLILCSSACAMHCRYCFRQHFPYEIEQKGFHQELQAIRQDTSIHEVILSGGDPLSLSDEVLDNLLQDLAAMDHVKRIRFHTRFPIGIPERIDAGFLKVIQAYPKQIYIVLHINHPNELDQELFDHLKGLQRLGVILLNQAVLLRGVNDHASVISHLCEQLIDQGILPYYLHQLDRVEGAAHFEVSEQEGLKLLLEASKGLPGYGVPKYVREIPGEPFKTHLT